MPKEYFDIYFAGQLLDGQDEGVAREQVRRIFKASDDQLASLFSGRPMLIKKGVDQDTAARFRAAFRQAGALVDIRPAPAPVQPPPPLKSATRAEPAWGLAPANTGSLESYAAPVQPAPLPDISALRLAATGSPLDERPPLPEVMLDTSGIELVAGPWSLEDCRPNLPPAHLPDISQLALDAPGAALDTRPPPPAPPLPDISRLQLDPNPGEERP